MTIDEKISIIRRAGFQPDNYVCSGLICGDCELNDPEDHICRYKMVLRTLNWLGYDIVKIK